MPERYGAWNSVYRRFQEWAESGVLRQVFKDLSGGGDLYDISTSVKADQASAGAKKGT